jgi:uncharacterized protein (TIGR01777 family)
MRVIITGGTGFIGRHLTNNLVKDRHEVIVLTRDKNKSNGVNASARRVEWDARTANGWGELADGADAIINLAGENIAGGGLIPERWTPARRERLLNSRLNAGNAVVEAVRAAAQKPSVVIQASGTNYYGTHSFEEKITEAHPPGDDFLSNVVIQWEAATAPVEAMGVRRVVTRTGAVLSTHDGMLPWMGLPFKLFVGGKIGSGKQPLSWVHIEDYIRAIRFFIDTPTTSGVYNLSAPEPLMNEHFSNALGEALNRPSYFPTPGFPFKLVFGELGDVLLLKGQSVIPKRLVEAGFRFEYPDANVALRDLYQKGK